MAVLVAVRDRTLRERIGGAISLRYPVTLAEDPPEDVERYDVLLVDLENLRSRETTAPPIIVVVHPESDNLEESMLEPAEDFVSVNASERELVLRVAKVLKKKGPKEGTSIQIRDLVIYPHSYEVLLDGNPIVLSLKEYELLKFLASHPGRVFTRDTLLDAVWGDDYFGGARTVDVHIRRLRAKLEVGGRRFIETVRGVGYKLV
ncbi:MAG TPA: response regulator transcription factor [Candidatus Latescibacteria bacterium]|nr:response regulator transcription factor [Candidatus Latescibacterota bacterium]